MVVLLTGIAAVVVQSALLHLGWPAPLLPQLVLLLVVYLGFHESSLRTALLVYLLGILLDLSYAVLVGPWAGALVTVYGVLVLLSARLFIESGLVAAFVSGCAVVVAGGVYLLLGYEYRSVSIDDFWCVCGQALVTALVAPLIVGQVVRRLKRRVVPGSPRSLLAS
jgi:rod shape-determining protein MreD